ncbi:BspA family leucine-rich repeat surface protein [Maribacter sp. Asnod1-A12]|uniref:BspA family leucine-rich repeat surface protein n=1 Tax=Maribacter sp. Asnod1-A12 TaxID=3160576 RepID=UPI00386EBCFE
MSLLKKSIALCLFLLSANLFSQSFTSIWNTNNIETGSSANNQITVPTNPAYTTYNFDIDWGDSTTDTGVTGNITHTYATSGSYTISISGTFPSIYFNDEVANDKLKIIEILSWGNIQWQTMENAFYGCENLNFDAIDSPDLSQVTTLKYMFRGCTSFNGIINDWDISNITDLSGLFYGCNIFNRPLDLWTTNAVTDMSETFAGARDFNEPLDNWNTANVTTMYRMFYGASDFNQNINNWIVDNVTNMSGTFYSTGSFNEPLNNWNVSKVTFMSSMFDGSGFNQPIDNWNVSNVTNMYAMFRHAVYNHPLDSWDVSSVVYFSEMFQRHRTFNQPLNSWNVSNATDMHGMFDGWIWGQVFNQALDNWNVSNVTDMSYMFRDNTAFNQDISGWDVSNVINMEGMFEDTTVFNQDISSWNVSNVTNMTNMFQQTDVFNQPLNSWNVANVTDITGIFSNAAAFNQPLNNWNLANTTNFVDMFNNAVSFNQDISGWDTSGITNMGSMFNGATSFDSNISSWNIYAVTNMNNIFSNSGISQENYDNILIAWAGQTVSPGVNLGATNLQYCDALNQRQSLIDDDGWNITGDAVNCSYVLCTEITMPHASDTATPANSDIRWDPAPNATGYRIYLELERGGARNYVNINGSPANNLDVGNTVGVSFTNEFDPGDIVYVTVVPYNDEGPAVGCQEINFTVVESWVNSPDAFKLTYDTTLQEGTTTTPINQLIIQTQSSFTYDYNIDWGDGQYDNNVTGDITHTYLTPGIYTVSIIGTFPSPRHNQSSGDAYKLLSIDQWGTQVWESMNNAFAGCENMEYNATDVPNLTNVTDMTSMFIVCNKFNGDINNWDVSNVTGMYGVFGSADIFNQPLNNWDVSNVTNMNFMFASTDEFNQDISSWNVGNVTDMARMFNSADSFNQPLNSWNVSNVTDMSQLFYSAEVFDQPLDSWNVTKVEEMDQMFYSAEAFNQNIDSWDVSSVTTMSQMFYYALAFNEPLNSWNVSSVTTMNSMFYNAETFNQPLDNWNVSSVNTMASMFSSTDSFNQNIDSWNVTNVTNMSSMFSYALNFDQPLNSWDVNSVVNMSSMFRGAAEFNQPLIDWDVSAVANMTSMFEDAVLFNQPINTWNVSSVTLMESMFEDAAVFNQDLNNWNTAVVTNFNSMFKNSLVFDGTITNWNTGEALNMAEMFSGATAFNQNIDSWDVSFVTTMEAMFNEATSYNQTMNSWNVASVTTMEDMFKNAGVFNENIGDWNVRGVTTMEEMFSGATSFNQDLNNWRISGVNNMDYMFRNASAYNQPMDLWNPGNVTMRSMFHDATALNQSLAEWDVSGVTNMSDMLDNTALIRENYDNTLIAWSEQTLTSGITLGAEGLPYCDAQEERQSMIDTYGWTFSQDVRDCPIPECTQLASPLNGDTDVPVNTNITWDAALFAQGYRLTVGTSAGGNDIVDNETITNETSFEFTSDFNTGDTVYVTITPFNDEGDAVGPCTEESFTISTDPATIPECTNLTEPLHSATDVAVTTDLSWNPISNADGYKLTVGTSSGANDLLDSEDIGNINTYEFTSDLPEDSDIFVTIIPYNDEGDATSCTEESFHTELIPVPPVCTTLTSPINDATDVAIDTHLSWTPIANATGYLVLVGTTSGGIEIVNNADVVGASTYDIPVDLQEGRLHYVTIIPYNDEGDATGCTEETFTTGDSTSPPSCTTLTAPINGATAVDPGTNLTWAELSSATGYKLTVGTTSGGSDIFTDDVLNVTTYDLAADLPESTPIYVTVTPYNDNGDAIGCTEESFTTDGAPLCTTLTTPANGATNVPVDTNIEWNTVANTDGYRITVIGSNSTANNMTDFEVTSGNTFNFSNDFIEGETVTVTIKPYNNNGEASGCTSETFTIVPPPVPTCTTLITPVNNTANADIDTDISWNAVAGATGYTITVTASESTANNLTEVDVIATSYDFTNDFIQGEMVTVTITPFNESGAATGCTSESFAIKPVPTCTSLNTPVNGNDAVDASISISWDAVYDAIGYFVTISANTSTANNVTDFKTTATSLDFTDDFTQGETVSVTIIPYNESGNAIGCTTESFSIQAVPTCTGLISPANGAIDVPVNTDIEWTTVPEADGYLLTVTGSSSSANNVDQLNITTGNSHMFTNDFDQGETVSVTIIPYNNAGEAIGCTMESFSIKSIPNCTFLTSPLNGAVLAEVNEISWNTVPDADGYRLTVFANNSTANNVSDLEVTDTTYTFPNEFNEGETVTVTIVPFNDIGDAIGCVSESFTIRPLPTCTNLIASLQNVNNVAVTADIEWNPSNDADGYRISIGTTANGNDIVDNEDVASLTSYILNEDLPSETQIFITITPYNSSGDAESCTTESFTTEVIAPDCAVLISPTNGETNVSLESTISWNEVEKTNGYRISIGTSANSNDIIDNVDMGNLTTYTHHDEFPFDTEIFVNITSYNSAGESAGCETQSFTTMIPEDETKYGFSPDGDGINEYWHIENIDYYPENVVSIYNRWGDMVFQIENYDNAANVFSGTANMSMKLGADQLPAGTYFFNIQIDGETILRKTQGFLVLKR